MATRVLVVEDEPSIAWALSGALEMLGYEVYPAAVAEEALAVLKRWPPSVVVLDLHGAGDADAVARAANGYGVPVVLSSASSRPYLVAARQRLGATGVLAKPFNLDDLGTVIKAAIPAECA